MNCPACGRFTGKRIAAAQSGKVKRMCSACDKPILKPHKYFLNSQQRSQHRFCEHPEFRSKEEAREAREPKPAPLFEGYQ